MKSFNVFLLSRSLAIAFPLSPTSDTPRLTPHSYIQMSGMILGSMIEADKRMIAYEHRVRHHKRMQRDMEVWRRFENDFETRGTPGVGGEGKVKGNQPEL